MLIVAISICIHGFLFSQDSGSDQDELFCRVEALVRNPHDGTAQRCVDSIISNDSGLYQRELAFFLRCRGICEFNEGHYTESFRLLTDALKMAQAEKNELEVGKSSLELGRVFIQFDEWQVANKMFKQAEEIFKSKNLESEYNTASYFQAVSYKRMGDFEASNEILQSVLDRYETLGDSAGMAKAYNAIGLNYKNLWQKNKVLTDFGRAVDNFNLAISLFKSTEDAGSLSKAYNNLANIYQHGKDWEQALLNHQNSLSIKQSLKDTLGMAVSYTNIAVIYKEKNDLKKAFEYANQSLDLINEIGEEANNSKIGIYHFLTNLYEKAGQHKVALEYAKKESELRNNERVTREALLIELFERKQDVKFYTISDSLLKNQKILQSKFAAAKDKNEELTKENDYVFTVSMILVILLLMGLVIVVYWRFLSAKRMQKELKAINNELYETRISKAEKEVLLQEIHHRVKNNMQIISSLIRLQSNQTDVESARALFSETQNRINSMALVHEQLYQTKDFEKLELNGYLTELISHLISSYRGDIPITKKVEISLNKASIDYIIPIGLIVNEIISNSLKHAFNGRESGEVVVSFDHRDNGKYTLELSDNGVGESGASSSNESSLGMELIDSLVTQIDGVMKLDKSVGYHYTIEIPQIIKPLN